MPFDTLQLVCEKCAKDYPNAFPGGLTPHAVLFSRGDNKAIMKQCINCGAVVKSPLA